MSKNDLVRLLSAVGCFVFLLVAGDVRAEGIKLFPPQEGTCDAAKGLPLLWQEGKPLKCKKYETCAANQYLVAKNNDLECKNLPVCSSEEVLFADASGIKCKPIDQPICPAGEALVGKEIESEEDGTTTIMECQKVLTNFAELNITCASGKVLQSISKGAPVCVTPPTGSSTPSTPSTPTCPSTIQKTSCVNNFCSDICPAIIFPVVNSSYTDGSGHVGRQNTYPVRCDGYWEIDTRYNKWFSYCSTGWVLLANCQGFSDCPKSSVYLD